MIVRDTYAVSIINPGHYRIPFWWSQPTIAATIRMIGEVPGMWYQIDHIDSIKKGTPATITWGSLRGNAPMYSQYDCDYEPARVIDFHTESEFLHQITCEGFITGQEFVFYPHLNGQHMAPLSILTAMTLETTMETPSSQIKHNHPKVFAIIGDSIPNPLSQLSA